MHRCEPGQLGGSLERAPVRVVVLEPGQPRARVLLRRRDRRGRRFARHLAPHHRVREVHEDPAALARLPLLERMLVLVDLLPHLPARAQTHVHVVHPRIFAQHHRHDGIRCVRRTAPLPACQALPRGRRERMDQQLDPAMLRRARELLLRRVALPQRHRHELPDHAFTHRVAIQPRLIRHHHVVLRRCVERVVPAATRHRVDLAGRDLHREGITVARVEPDPQRLRLVHREHHAATPEPRLRDPPREVIHVTQRERPQPGRQRILASIIRDPQRTLELHPQHRVRMHLGEAELQAILPQLDHHGPPVQ